MKVSTLGIDLAKNVFQLHGVDHEGHTILRKKLTRAKFVQFVIQLEPCLIGMEACSSSHHFARLFTRYGHEVKLIPPQYVKPYVKTNKTDAADAEAICEAVTRPNMRFVQIKTEEQQAVLALHTERGILIRERIACSNSLRATLAEFGITIGAGQSHLTRELPAILEDGENGLSPFVRTSIYRQAKHIRELEEQVKQVEEALASWYRTQEACQRIAKIPGIGMLTATYVVAAVGNARQFSTAKQFASWLGLTPKEHSSGGKQQLGGISKRGDGYFRYLLVHGARALTAWVNRNGAVEENAWLQGLLERKHYNVAVVAMAAKTARIMWSMLTHNTEYQPRQLA